MSIQPKRDCAIIIKEGFLMKRGHVRHNWKTRWFKLSDTSLRYYKSRKEKVPQGRISLRNAKLSIYQSDHKNDKGREFVMQIETSDGIVYPIQAPSNEELKTWMEFIHDVIEHLELENDVYTGSCSIPDSLDMGDLSSSEILGNYIDMYGGIKLESRTVNGKIRDDGFSGVALRVWMEHTLGMFGTDAEMSVSASLRKGLLELVDGDPKSDPFDECKYYVLIRGEGALKDMVTDTRPAPKKSTSSHDDFHIPADIVNAAQSPTAVLPSDLPNGEIVKRGILFKKGHVIPNWKVRCFVLQQFPATLSYFDPSKKNPKVLNSLSLHGASVFTVGKMAAQAALGMRHPPDHLFCVKVSTGTLYIIMASSDIEREDWIEAIKPMCRKLKGSDMTEPNDAEI